LAPPAISLAASNTATSLMPLNDGTQLETRAVLDWHRANGSCDFTVGAERKTGDGVTGFPSDLWSRQSTDIRSSDRPVYLDVHATAQYDRVFKEGGHDDVTTVCMGEGAPDKYQTTGRIDSTDWRTGQPRTDLPSSCAPTSRWSTAGTTSPHRAPARRPPSPDVIQPGIATSTRPLRGPLSTWSCAAAISASG
jgi:hypothetical protein